MARQSVAPSDDTKTQQLLYSGRTLSYLYPKLYKRSWTFLCDMGANGRWQEACECRCRRV